MNKTIMVHNTLNNRKEEFKTLEPGKVKIYVCGPTTYNYIHLGNARPIVVFDTIRRYLTYAGYDVTYIQNFTDVDDKIIKRANEENDESMVDDIFATAKTVKEELESQKLTTLLSGEYDAKNAILTSLSFMSANSSNLSMSFSPILLYFALSLIICFLIICKILS